MAWNAGASFIFGWDFRTCSKHPVHGHGGRSNQEGIGSRGWVGLMRWQAVPSVAGKFQPKSPGVLRSFRWNILFKNFEVGSSMPLTDTVDGSEIRETHQLKLVVYPIINRVLYIPGGAGFLPSTVSRLEHVSLIVFFLFSYFFDHLPLASSLAYLAVFPPSTLLGRCWGMPIVHRSQMGSSIFNLRSMIA